MPNPTNFPNQFNGSVNFTSTGADIGFGFIANVIRMRNRSSKSVYIDLGSTTGATTGDHELGSSEDITLPGMMVSGMSFVASSSGGFLTIGAWGN